MFESESGKTLWDKIVHKNFGDLPEAFLFPGIRDVLAPDQEPTGASELLQKHLILRSFL